MSRATALPGEIPGNKLNGMIAAKLLSGLWISAAWLVLPAAAQDRAGSEIVVTGTKDKERDRQIRDFVHGMTESPGTDPLARFDTEKLCPRSVGLGTGQDKAITDRMRRVAEAAKIDLAREDCRYPNALVIFADDKAVMIDRLHKQYPGLFRNAHGDAMVVGKESGPAAAWHVDIMVSRDGVPIGPGRTLRTAGLASRLQAMARPVYVMSIVVIERRGVVGLTMTQIADYAAMRAYTDADPARAKESGAPTILTILEAAMGSETPLSMTAWDLSFMRGLYAAPANAHSSAQRGAIGESMKRELSKGRDEKR